MNNLNQISNLKSCQINHEKNWLTIWFDNPQKRNALTFDLIDLLYDSGMRGVNLGIESGDTEILKNSGKRNPSIQKQWPSTICRCGK